MPETMAAKGPYLCILGGLDAYAGSCGIPHETKADSTEHLKALRAADPDVWSDGSSATIADIEGSREEVVTDAE